MVRQAQVDAMHRLKNVWTLPAEDVSMYDFIHNSAGGNLVLGERAAKCALSNLYGRPRDWRAPEAVKAVRLAPDAVELRFDQILNWVNPFDPPAALLPFEAEDAQGLVSLVSYETRANTLLLTFERPLGEGAVLHGAWRSNPGQVVPWDCMRYPMLAFYSLPVTNE
jgi:hypothetical protein